MPPQKDTLTAKALKRHDKRADQYASSGSGTGTASDAGSVRSALSQANETFQSVNQSVLTGLQTSFGVSSTTKFSSSTKLDKLQQAIDEILSSMQAEVKTQGEKIRATAVRSQMLQLPFEVFDIDKYYYEAVNDEGKQVLRKKHIDMSLYEESPLTVYKDGVALREPVYDSETGEQKVNANGELETREKVVAGYKLKDGIQPPAYYPDKIFPGKFPHIPAHYPEELDYVAETQQQRQDGRNPVYEGKAQQIIRRVNQLLKDMARRKASFFSSSYSSSTQRDADIAQRHMAELTGELSTHLTDQAVLTQTMIKHQSILNSDLLAKIQERIRQIEEAIMPMKIELYRVMGYIEQFSTLIQRAERRIKISSRKYDPDSGMHCYKIVSSQRRREEIIVGEIKLDKPLEQYGYYPVANINSFTL